MPAEPQAAVVEEMSAVREAVALSSLEHVRCLRVEGPGAFQLLDRACSSELYLRDGQVLQSLLLDDMAHPFADVLLARDDEAFFLLAEGPDPEALVEHLGAPGEAAVTVVDLTASHRLLSVNGPYAWELMAAVVGPEVLGLPYLSFFRSGGAVWFRAGKTGEYGYDALVPEAEAAALEARLREAGARFQLGSAGLPTLDQCALENWFFNVRREGQTPGVTPLELQLQWRVSYRKDFRGSAALRARRRQGARRRLTCLLSAEPLQPGDPVFCEEREIGTVLAAGHSSTRGEWVGSALLDVAYAYPWVDRYEVERADARQRIRTAAPPVINNRSLHVNPQRHTFAGRGQDDFPPLVPPSNAPHRT